MSLENELFLDKLLQTYTDENSVLYSLSKEKLKEGLLIKLSIWSILRHILSYYYFFNHKKIFQFYNYDEQKNTMALRMVDLESPLIWLFPDEKYLVKLYYNNKCLDYYISQKNFGGDHLNPKGYFFKKNNENKTSFVFFYFLLILLTGKVYITIKLIKEGNFRKSQEESSFILAQQEEGLKLKFKLRQSIFKLQMKNGVKPKHFTDQIYKENVYDINQDLEYHSRSVWKTKDIQLINTLMYLVSSRNQSAQQFLKSKKTIMSVIEKERNQLKLLLNEGRIS